MSYLSDLPCLSVMSALFLLSRSSWFARFVRVRPGLSRRKPGRVGGRSLRRTTGEPLQPEEGTLQAGYRRAARQFCLKPYAFLRKFFDYSTIYSSKILRLILRFILRFILRICQGLSPGPLSLGCLRALPPREPKSLPGLFPSGCLPALPRGEPPGLPLNGLIFSGLSFLPRSLGMTKPPGGCDRVTRLECGLGVLSYLPAGTALPCLPPSLPALVPLPWFVDEGLAWVPMVLLCVSCAVPAPRDGQARVYGERDDEEGQPQHATCEYQVEQDSQPHDYQDRTHDHFLLRRLLPCGQRSRQSTPEYTPHTCGRNSGH